MFVLKQGLDSPGRPEIYLEQQRLAYWVLEIHSFKKKKKKSVLHFEVGGDRTKEPSQ